MIIFLIQEMFLNTMSEKVKERLEKIRLAIKNITDKAAEDGVVTKEEQKIIETARDNLLEYEKLVKEAMEDGIITTEEMNSLIDLEENLLSETYFTAIEDNKIDSDELILLKTLIKTIDKNASVSWLEEDT